MKRKRKITVFVNDLSIDKANLDVELEKQPNLYMKWAERLAHANNELDEAKAHLKYTEAEVAQKIRTYPDHYGVKRPTDKAVESAIILTEEYQQAQTAFIAAKHKVGIMEGMVTGCDHKKSSIHDLCYLQSQGYYADTAKPMGTRPRREGT